MFLHENGRPDWFVTQFINKKLEFLNNFIELQKPYNNDLSNDKLEFTHKSTLKFNFDYFDIFVTDYYKKTDENKEIIVENSPLNPYSGNEKPE